MSRKMKAIIVGAGVLAAVLVGGAGYHIPRLFYREAACVTVNGTVLTNQEVDLAYDQQKEGVQSYTRDQVVDATVRNMVVRDYGKAQGISVTAEELDHLIAHYKETGYYEAAVKRYGEAGLRQGLLNHELFIRTKDIIFQKELSFSAVTEADVTAFLQENGLEDMTLTADQREDVVSTLTEHKKQEAYNAFVDKLVDKAEIVYG